MWKARRIYWCQVIVVVALTGSISLVLFKGTLTCTSPLALGTDVDTSILLFNATSKINTTVQDTKAVFDDVIKFPNKAALCVDTALSVDIFVEEYRAYCEKAFTSPNSSAEENSILCDCVPSNLGKYVGLDVMVTTTIIIISDH